MTSEKINVVIVDDDDGHALLIERNLFRGGFPHALIRLRDGQEVVDFLNQRILNPDHSSSGPLILLLDIRMPRMDGIEVLKNLKSIPEFRNIPVIMLTTTDNPAEIEKCYLNGCNVYIVKPLLYDEFAEAMRRLGTFLQLVKFPQVFNS